MLFLILQALVLYSCTRLSWRVLRRFVVKTDLNNIPGPPAASFWKGNFRQLFNVDGWGFHKSVAETCTLAHLRFLFGANSKRKTVLITPMQEKQLYIFDPKALHHIIVKDQYVYEESDQFINQPIGEHHRKQRKMLNPVFSIAHMRNMVPIFYDVAYKLQSAFTRKVAQGSQEIDVVPWMARTALELIGQSGLGWSFDTLEEGAPMHPFCYAVKHLIPTNMRLMLARTYIFPYVAHIGPAWLQRWVVDILPWKNLHRLRDIVDTMHNTSTQIFEEKKRALREGDEAIAKQVGQGKDIMSILMRANMQAADEDRLPDSEVLAQVTLTFAAMDTTSNALSRILYILATHTDAQNKLRAELHAACNAGDLSYDDLVSLPYLDAVCRETLRLNSGPNNTTVNISILNSNRNPAVWGPDAGEWKPERWLGGLPDTVIDAHVPGIYSHLMTFLGGGRACIGFKFSQLEMKVVLSLLVRRFTFAPAEGKDIVWEMNGIVSPSVKGSTGPPSQLPLKVTLLK
ncbi:cytochrome P450 [Infundibulicybe gibba]|nr:cytochrome P450 [Infundibulicybe gibba]